MPRVQVHIWDHTAFQCCTASPFTPVIVITSCAFKHLKKQLHGISCSGQIWLRLFSAIRTFRLLIVFFFFFNCFKKQGHGEHFFPLASDGLECYKAKRAVSWGAPVRALAFLFCSLLVSSSVECLVSTFQSRLEKGLLLPALLRLMMEKNLRTKVLG